MTFQELTDNLKHVMHESAARGREWLFVLKRKLRSLPRPLMIKIGAVAAVLAVFGGALALRSEARATTHRLFARTALRDTADAPRPPRAASKIYVAGSSEESQGDYKAAAQSYATAFRRGDGRGLDKLVAMTRAPDCHARSEAADALGGFRSTRATAALKKLAEASFRDESRSPGIFSCSSRRAAVNALEKQSGG